MRLTKDNEEYIRHGQTEEVTVGGSPHAGVSGDHDTRTHVA